MNFSKAELADLASVLDQSDMILSQRFGSVAEAYIAVAGALPSHDILSASWALRKLAELHRRIDGLEGLLTTLEEKVQRL